MAEFKYYRAIGQNDGHLEITIASYPVIIEKGKVLLDKEGQDGLWKFPGGSQLDVSNFLYNSMRGAKEELGIDVVLEGEPCLYYFDRDHQGIREHFISVHYLAKREGNIVAGERVGNYGWFDINSLPEDLTPNVIPVLRYFKLI